MNDIELWWVGNRAYELKGCESLFKGGIAIVGNQADARIPITTYEGFSNRRINFNNPKWNDSVDNFLKVTITNIINKSHAAKFFWHSQLNFNQDALFISCSIYNNSIHLINQLNNKAYTRRIFSNKVSAIPCTAIPLEKCDHAHLEKLFPRSEYFVVQSLFGSGGHETFLLSKNSFNVEFDLSQDDTVLVSTYYPKMLPINQHVIVNNDEIICLPPSVQIVEVDETNRIVYRGGDYSAITFLDDSQLDKIHSASTNIGRATRLLGYKGCIGVDYLIDESNLYFVEVNPRFQASTRLLNECLISKGLPTVYEMHIACFTGSEIPYIEKFQAVGSFYYTNCVDINEANRLNIARDYISPDSRNTPFSQDNISINIEYSELDDSIWVEPGADHCRIGVNRGVTAYLPEQGRILDKTITSAGKLRPTLISSTFNGSMNAAAKLKFDLLSFGMSIDDSATSALQLTRQDLTIRDGIAGGLEVWFCNNIHVNVPIKEFFSLISPYRLIFIKNDNQFAIADQHNNAIPIGIAPLPSFVERFTSRGTPMVDVGQMMLDRLSLEIVHGCIFNSINGLACKFCELGAEAITFNITLEDIRELVLFCLDSPSINLRHILLGGSTPSPTKWDIFFKVIELIRMYTDKPIYLMISPPDKFNKIKTLKQLGLNEIGINLEFFNRNIAKRIMPGKGSIPLKNYSDVLDFAVELWGSSGSVRSILIVGIEPLDDTIKGVEFLAAKGVLPILSPFRPIPGTPLHNHPPAASELLYEAWDKGQEIAEKYGLTLGPTCIACKNNTISMPYSTLDKYY